MIICPACREEIDDDSHYCDQCGQELFFCNHCGRVGLGRRCTYCGGLMLSAGSSKREIPPGMSVTGYVSHIPTEPGVSQPGSSQNIPVMTLANDSLNIRLVAMNGAIIGRRQGPYTQFFEHQAYVSGVHAQLKYKSGTGWCIADKHSSNGTRLNQHLMQPDVEMTLSNGDILTIANINLQVIIR
ncbi:FHA domain-containing protein [Prevotella aff. ruminicola Tc2-24]|uniref:FHA domain-containing protein n=1 Tax=Prevotella aff. ruminicola Tc2-24 TaxID=81582 RepID=A0A1I0PWL1_9BACT|nr:MULTISPECIES: FHA domain-containing protein [Prevotella]SEE60964.1 FHA domain-containing protein [Prevotella sp. lc2012]SEW18693.1 FHA domain-containing protein [Prevotella aff. ruminicola Tc2-24]